MSKEVLIELNKMFMMILLMSVIELLLFLAFGHFNLAVVFGCLLGALVSFLNFLFLALSIEKSVSKGKKSAQMSMGTSYSVRLMFIAAAVVFAIKSPHINYLAALIPLIFPRISIMISEIILKKRGAKTNERSEDII